MIVRPKPNFWNILFTLKGSIARAIALRLVTITALAAAITLFSERMPALFLHFSAAPFTLIGLSLSIFMSFRNNACYERWWEGRKQWGTIIGELRSLIRDTDCVAPSDHDRARMLRALCGFAHALAAQLRDGSAGFASADWIDADDVGQANPTVPDSALAVAGRAIDALEKRQAISSWRATWLLQRLGHMASAQAACERIRTTPLPFAYTLLLHRTAYLFCCLLPFGLAGPLGWATPLITAIVSYTFFGLDALGDELEQPFGRDANDLPLNAIVRIIERDIRAALGETDLPPPLEPVDFVLL
jgi:putative membrane protein